MDSATISKRFRKMAKVCIGLGIIELIAGIIVFFWAVSDEEEFIILGIGLAVFGITTAWFLSLIFFAAANVLDHLKSIEDNSKKIAVNLTASSVSTTKAASSEDIPEI